MTCIPPPREVFAIGGAPVDIHVGGHGLHLRPRRHCGRRGRIRSIDDLISGCIPVDTGSAFDGVSVKTVLQMSAGARWSGDYSDPTSDIHRLGSAMAGIITHDEFVAGMVRESAPGDRLPAQFRRHSGTGSAPGPRHRTHHHGLHAGEDV